MSEKKHTPGPWKIGRLIDKYEEQYLGVFNGEASEGEKTPAVCILSRIADATETDAANARLIRAAPEMLDLLEEIYKGADWTSVYYNNRPIHLLDRMTSIIKSVRQNG